MKQRGAFITGGTIFFLGTIAFAQVKPIVTQKSQNSACSNIVALAGNVDIKCSSLTAEQEKLLKSIPSLLNKILLKQPDPTVLMDKMDEILAAASKPSQTINAPFGIGGSGGTYINPTVNNIGPVKPSIEGLELIPANPSEGAGGHPISTYKFSLSSMPTSQRFLAICDRPCTESWAEPYPRPSLTGSNDWGTLLWPDKKPNTVGWQINAHMDAHQEFTVSVVSGDDQPAKILRLWQP